jgi:membrane-bound lytic murein transglycosylase D
MPIRKWLGLAVAALFVLQTTAQAALMPMDDLRFAKARPRTHKISIPLENNASIRAWIQFFTGRNRERFARFMDRGRFVKTKIQDILVANGVPAEMYYLAMIESGFASHARSRTAAVGIWQFMPSTARRFGLRVDNYVDERLDMIKATGAAAKYLKSLHGEFGDWYLAMAAYNTGENRVRRAIRVGRTKNYWALARRGFLLPETAQYIAKFQAAMTIAKYPNLYRFSESTFYDYPRLQKLHVRGNYVSIDNLASRHGLSSATLRALNPHLVRGVVPPGVRTIYAPRAM